MIKEVDFKSVSFLFVCGRVMGLKHKTIWDCFGSDCCCNRSKIYEKVLVVDVFFEVFANEELC